MEKLCLGKWAKKVGVLFSASLTFLTTTSRRGSRHLKKKNCISK